MQTGKRKVGILGGTFDPVHNGHLILAQDSLEELGLSSVWFMPSGNPPHKRNRCGGARDDQRVEMLRLAIENDPCFELRLDDMHPSDYSYTYKLMESLHAEYPDTDFYFLAGADSLIHFEEWVEPGRILACASLAVAHRGELPSELLEKTAAALTRKYGGEIRILSSRNIDISSEELRRRAKEGRKIRYFVPERVASYISDQHLYKDLS